MENFKNDFRYFGGLTFIYGVIFVFCLYENFIGITFPIYVAATIGFSVLFLKRLEQSIKRSTIKYFVGMMLLGVSTFMTGNTFVHFFNWVGIILLLIAGMIHQLYDDNEWGFLSQLKNLFKLLGLSILNLITPLIHAFHFLKGSEQNADVIVNQEGPSKEIRVTTEHKNDIEDTNHLSQQGNERGKSTILMVLLGLGLATLLSFIIVPLLMLSDEIFAQFFRNILQHINIRHIVGITITFLVGAIPFYSFFFALFKRNLQGNKGGNGKKADSMVGISFTFVFAVIYMIYSIIQILFLFLRFEGGLPENVAYYQYAHQGFWQLLAVSLINFAMVLVCIQVFVENKLLKSLLLIISICTCIMTVSAVYRMLLYVGAYHLTFLRVLVLWFFGVLTLIMGGVMVSIYRNKFRLFKYVMAVVACGYILFSFARVDFIIASYNLAHTENIAIWEVRYLMNDLSIDAAPAIRNFDLSATTCEFAHEHLSSEIESYYNRILRQDNSGRRWNLSLHLAQRVAKEQVAALNASR